MKFIKMTFCKESIILLLSILFSQNLYCKNNINEISDGFYSSPSKRCTQFEKSKNKFVSCEREFNDCLIVKKINDENISIEIYSTQANQHVCAANGIAKNRNGAISYYFGSESNSQHIDLIKRSNEIHLKQHVPVGEDSENCGAYASFDGLIFKKIDNDVNKHICFKN